MADGRGVAVADFDGDGRQDLVVANNDAPPDLYLNRTIGGDFLAVDLRGTSSPRDPVGARLRLTILRADGAQRILTRWVEAGSGYSSQSSLRVHFGLGRDSRATHLHVLWPSGLEQVIEAEGLAGRRHLSLVEGEALKTRQEDLPHG